MKATVSYVLVEYDIAGNKESPTTAVVNMVSLCARRVTDKDALTGLHA
jgi:hypothetical protein